MFQNSSQAKNQLNGFHTSEEDRVQWSAELRPFLADMADLIDAVLSNSANVNALSLALNQQSINISNLSSSVSTLTFEQQVQAQQISAIASDYVSQTSSYQNPDFISSLSFTKIDGLGNLGTINTNSNGNQFLAGDGAWKGVSFSTILDKPSTLAGYGIGDAFPLSGGTLSGTAGNGFVGYSAQSAIPNAPTNGFRLFANSSNALSWRGANGFVRTFDGTANTADRSYILPNSSGTFGLLESSQTWLGANTFSEQAIFSKNIRLGLNTVTSSFGNSLFVTPVSSAASSVSVTLANFDNTGRWSMGIQGSGNNRFGIYDEINNAYRLFIHGTTGNVQIGSTVDSGFRLDVIGTGRVTDILTVGTSSKGASDNAADNFLVFTNSNSTYSIRGGVGSLIFDGPSFILRSSGSGTHITRPLLCSNNNSGNDVRMIGIKSVNGANSVVSFYTERYASWTAGETPRLRLSSKSFELWSDNEATAWNVNFVRRLLSLNENGQLLLSYDLSSGLVSHNSSAVLQIESTTRGVLGPRMTTNQINQIANPANGLEVFNTDLGVKVQYSAVHGGWIRYSHTSM